MSVALHLKCQSDSSCCNLAMRKEEEVTNTLKHCLGLLIQKFICYFSFSVVVCACACLLVLTSKLCGECETPSRSSHQNRAIIFSHLHIVDKPREITYKLTPLSKFFTSKHVEQASLPFISIFCWNSVRTISLGMVEHPTLLLYIHIKLQTQQGWTLG